MKTDLERPLSDGEIAAIRHFIDECDRASKRDDFMGRFLKHQLDNLPIPLVLWGKGHTLR